MEHKAVPADEPSCSGTTTLIDLTELNPQFPVIETCGVLCV